MSQEVVAIYDLPASLEFEDALAALIGVPFETATRALTRRIRFDVVADPYFDSVNFGLDLGTENDGLTAPVANLTVTLDGDPVALS